MAQPHRGLPPPAAMTLPTAPPPSSIGPIPPHLWQNSDETVRSLLHVKAQELQHAAEQERTKQEEIKLRRREAELRIRETELNVIREAIQGGMTGSSLAMIFGQNSRVTEIANDWEYRPQPRAPPPPTPELRRETRLIGPASAPQHQQAMAPPAVGPSWDTHQPGFSSYHATRGSSTRSSQSGQSQPAPQPLSQGPPHRSALPRINTNEIQSQKPSQLSGPAPILNPSPMPHPTPQSSTAEAPPVAQSPGIYFHHWQPPSTQVGSQASAQRASSPQRQLGSPFPHHHQPSHLSGSEVSSSPKRRKTTSGQPYSPPYQTAPSAGSSVTPARRRAHSRQRSDTYTTGMRPFESHNRPTTRQRRADTVSGHGDEHSVGPPVGEPMQISPDAGSGPQQQGSGQEQGGVPLPATAQQQQQPPSRPYSPVPDRSRELPYPGPPGSEGGQPPQGGNGRH